MRRYFAVELSCLFRCFYIAEHVGDARDTCTQKEFQGFSLKLRNFRTTNDISLQHFRIPCPSEINGLRKKVKSIITTSSQNHFNSV